MDYGLDLYQHVLAFKEGDDVTAREAFNHLYTPMSRFLHRLLIRMDLDEADRDDIIALTAGKLWEYRPQFEPEGLGAWWRLVAITAKRLVYGRARKQKEDPLPEDPPLADHDAIDEIAEWREHVKKLYQAADELWLGIEKGISSSLRARQRLAAQLFYLHNRPWQKICHYVGGKAPLDRGELDRWLAKSSVIKDMEAEHLFWDNDRLLAFVLRPSAPLPLEELSMWLEQSRSAESQTAPDGRPLAHLRILIWYFHNGLAEHKVRQMSKGVPKQEIDQVLYAARQSLPFSRAGEQLCAALRHKRVDPQILQEPGPWKRMVFGYNVQCQLPHDHTFERLGPAAEVIGYHITIDTITMGTSGKRLFAELLNYLKEEHPNA